MIDGLKILCLNVNRANLWNNPLIEPFTATNAKTGEINEDKQEAKVQGLRFTFWPDERIELNASLHKYFNHGFHNYNDFGLSELIYTLKKLHSDFGINPEKSRLNGLEIGVNIELPYSPETFLKSLIMHSGKPFTDQQDKTKRFRECSHSQAYIKSYDKGKQFNQKRFIVRFEIKFKKMEILNKQGIYTLSDLTKTVNFEFLGRFLLQTFDKTLIGNLQTDSSKLNDRDKLLFANGHNPAFWELLIPKSKDFSKGNADPEYKRQNKTYERKLKRFKELLTITGADQLKNEIRERIVQKINELSELKIQGEIDQQEQQNNIENLTDCETLKKGEIDRLLYSDIFPLSDDQKTTVCCVTGLDISLQKKGCRFLSQKTIRNFYFSNPETYQKLFKKYASKKKYRSREKQCYFIAHNIRNHYARTQRINRVGG